MKFTIYSKDGCSYCEQIKKLMKALCLDYVVYELGKDFCRDDFYNEFGEGSTFPQIVVGDQNIGGCKETIEFLRKQKILND
jgi:glutaredoxin